ncbi:MAG: HAD family hydrolase [Burkholderiaceae bacterium]
MLTALIFDVDGTLADTESAHRDAFNAAFKASGLDWHWSEEVYTKLLLVAGGKERIAHYWRQVDPARAGESLATQTISRLHALKTQEYEQRVAGGKLTLRPGVERLIREANAAGVPVAIATTTTPANVEVLLATPSGADCRTRFAVVYDAATPVKKKPAPDVYLAVLAALGTAPADCLAFEDSQNGLRAATAAGIPTIVTPTAYTAMHDFEGALLVLPHLGDPDTPMAQRIAGTDQRWVDLAALTRWHEGQLFEAS